MHHYHHHHHHHHLQVIGVVIGSGEVLAVDGAAKLIDVEILLHLIPADNLKCGWE